MEQHQALTIWSSGVANRLIVSVDITNAQGVTKTYPGLIDTGATHTVVSAELAAEMQFQAVSYTESNTAGGKVKDVPVYVIDMLSLCDGKMLFPNHRVMQMNLTDQVGVEMLIGMDILNQGDFSLTNKGGKTMASFRIPSVHETNYVPEVNNWNRFELERDRRRQNSAIRGGKKKKKR